MTDTRSFARSIFAIILIFPAFSQAQVPVDESGNVIGSAASNAEVMPLGEDGIPRLTSLELQELVGPVALYPDDLLAIVLPASAYPLQIAAAARFLEARELDPNLEPDANWDDSVVALLNYPEVVELLNADLDWTYRLGEAVVAQQTDVIAAVESFRDRAYAAGNLESDSYQTVARNDGVIHITPAAEDVIYVPYYEPARVVTYQSRPAYFYYPRPCPVYYYPYASNHYFDRGYFWGVTTAFSIGWVSDSLSVWHHSYRGHPYYGRRYRANDWWYRRPSINVYNHTYVDNTIVVNNRYRRGDRWRARQDRREYTRREGYSRDRNPAPRRVTQVRSPQSAGTTRTRQTDAIRFRDRTRSAETRIRSQNQVGRIRESASDARRSTQRSVTRDSRRQLENRQASREQRRQEARPAPQRQARSVPQRETRQASRREVRATPQRSVRQAPRRETRAMPQRSERQAPRREARAAPQRSERQAPQRQVRAAPERAAREAPRRESRSAPQRQSSRSTPQRQSRGESENRRSRKRDR